MQEEIVYLGFVISTNGLNIDLEKVKAILEWPTPKNVGKVRLSHGLDTFYRKFIENFSVLCNAMNKAMRGYKKDFIWIHRVHKSFEALKQKVVELPTLALSNFTKVFQVDCDANGSVIGAI